MAQENNSQNAEQVREILREWIELDNQERDLRNQIKQIKIQKERNSENILRFMRDNDVDNFSIEGQGNLSRSVRTTKPRLTASALRAQVLIQLADQPQKAADVLRSIEGGQGEEAAIGTQRELLVRRIPKN